MTRFHHFIFIYIRYLHIYIYTYVQDDSLVGRYFPLGGEHFSKLPRLFPKCYLAKCIVVYLAPSRKDYNFEKWHSSQLNWMSFSASLFWQSHLECLWCRGYPSSPAIVLFIRNIRWQSWKEIWKRDSIEVLIFDQRNRRITIRFNIINRVCNNISHVCLSLKSNNRILIKHHHCSMNFHIFYLVKLTNKSRVNYY